MPPARGLLRLNCHFTMNADVCASSKSRSSGLGVRGGSGTSVQPSSLSPAGAVRGALVHGGALLSPHRSDSFVCGSGGFWEALVRSR